MDDELRVRLAKKAFIAAPRAFIEMRTEATRGTDEPVLPKWSVLLQMTEAGEHGLRFIKGVSRPTIHDEVTGMHTPDPAFDDWATLCLLREADHGWPKDTTLLLKQNW